MNVWALCFLFKDLLLMTLSTAAFSCFGDARRCPSHLNHRLVSSSSTACSSSSGNLSSVFAIAHYNDVITRETLFIEMCRVITVSRYVPFRMAQCPVLKENHARTSLEEAGCCHRYHSKRILVVGKTVHKSQDTHVNVALRQVLQHDGCRTRVCVWVCGE